MEERNESQSNPGHGEREPAGASHEGQLIASPSLPGATQNSVSPDSTGGNGGDRRARGQFLTGRASREIGELSPGRLAWRQLKKNRLAMVGLWTLVFLYTVALFAPFLAPYSAVADEPGGQSLGYHPPMKLRWREANGTWHKRPFVYLTQRKVDENYQPIDLPDPNQPRVVRFFVRGDSYRLFGFIPSNLHLFGVEDGFVYVLGTDQQGRDYFSRLLYGSQISLSVGLVAIAISFTLGMLVGGISGFYGGKIDDLIMRGCEIMMSVPDFYLLLALAAALPADMNPVLVYVLIIVILSFVGWAGMARIIRGMTLSVREREYVEAGRALGQSDLQIIRRHILPSTFTYAIVAATMSVPGYILGEAGLSFLGLGIREPMASWGNMLSAAQDLTTIESRQWILAPGFVIFITTLAFNFLGDGLRDALDPKSRK
ncbi:MAG TPA: ABC transporter permease [Abditibacteriaceae bacterium]|jgi:peptide/nickel transport system permease protein